MSGDVQPRKRKDRRRKRDQNDKTDGEVSFSRKPSIQEDDESSHGVHITKMGSDDVHLHVQHDHGTGGHWCAKIFFFSLLVVLVGLVGLIIMENRGLSDLDTPLSESRFSNYFDGWVEEHRDEHGHDEHDDIQASIEEHDEHDEPFEEEEDHSEDDVDHEEDHDEDDEDEDQQTAEEDEDADKDDDEDGDDDGDDNQTAEDDEDEEVDSLAAHTVEEDDDDDDDKDDDNDNDDDNDDDNENDDDDADQTVEEDEQESQGGQTVEEDDQDDDEDDDDEADNDNATQEDNEDDDDQNDDNDEDDDQEATQEQTAEANQQDDDPFDEDEDDGTFESIEKVVENDAEELLLLQEKARQQAAESGADDKDAADDDDNDDEAAPSWASSPEPDPEILMKRRLTIASEAEVFPDVEDVPDLPNDDEFSEEEIEIEEEIEEEIIEEYMDSEPEEQPEEERHTQHEQSRYVPETFEQFNAMYRPQVAVAPNKKEENPREVSPIVAPTFSRNEQPATTLQEPNEPNEPSSSSSHIRRKKDTEEEEEESALPQKGAEKGAADGEYLDEADGDDGDYMVYLDDGDDVEISDEDEDDLDDLDIDDGDDDDEEYDDDHEEGDGDSLDDISDVDDSDLMNRLEAKYGRLPAKEFESDEDAEDPSWIQIKVKDTIGGGPQSMEDDFNSLERELRNANEEMMREVSTRAFDELQRKYPDRPQVFLAKAHALDRLAAERRSNKLLSLALEEFKRYLAFGELLSNASEFRQTAEHCIERIRFIGYTGQAVPIHMSLIERFPDEPRLRNQFAVTFLLMNDLPQAKRVLEQTLDLWPSDGFAQVHYGFVLQQLDKDYEQAAIYLHNGIYSNAPGTQDGLFYFKLGEALQRLGRQQEAVVVFQRGADLKLYPSAYQRSLYNEPKLRAKPFWSPDETYEPEFASLASNWQLIRREGVSLLNERGGFEPEAENLLAAGDWKQLELFADGRELPSCRRAPLTCRLLRQFKDASGCRAGQIKFSVMHPGTHVWPHCGPTNRRLRAHLGLVVPPGAYLRVAEEVRTWHEGEFLIFDDSFEHEVWHNGTSLRLILIVDIWHPDLSDEQRRTMEPFARSRTFG